MLINSYIFSSGGSVPVIESFSTNSYDTNSTTWVGDKPTGTVIGDLLLVFVVNDGPEPAGAEWDATSDPAGWTFLRNEGDSQSDSSTGVFWIIATSTETAASNFTFTSASAFDQNGTIMRISGVNATAVGVEGNWSSTTNSSQDITGITTGNNNSIAIGWHVGDGADTGPFSVSGTGWNVSHQVASASTGNDGNAAVVVYKDMASIGATGNAAVSSDPVVSDGVGSFMIEIRS